MKLKLLFHRLPGTRAVCRRTTTAVALAACLGMVSTAGPASAADKGDKKKQMTDQQITNAIDQTLQKDSALRNNQIDAKTNEGIVTLSGMAAHLLAKERATKLAHTIRGVRGVVNSLTLDMPSMTDDEIRKNVESALLYDAATDSYELTPTVNAGVVTLTGTVQSFREQQLALHVAKGVKGVKEVKNSITLKTRADRPDAEIAAEVKRAMAIDAWLNPSTITTEVKDGVVTLTGTVGSGAQHGRASLLAWTSGVKSVNAEGLKIDHKANGRAQRDDAITIKSDPQIKQAVQDAFVYDPRVFSFNPAVEVENGIVTLTGTVDNLKAKRAAEQDAKNTVGVWRVKNLLKVRPAKQVANDKLAKAVDSAFLRDPVVDSYEIDVTAKNGTVTLTGTVDSYFEKTKAEDVASRSNGVTDIRNNLMVSSPTLVYYDTSYDPYYTYQPYYYHRPPYHSTWPYTSDAEVKDDIEDEMTWSPFVDFDDITVKVENGAATLTGTANSWFEFQKATENAYEGGARVVYNNIKVD